MLATYNANLAPYLKKANARYIPREGDAVDAVRRTARLMAGRRRKQLHAWRVYPHFAGARNCGADFSTHDEPEPSIRRGMRAIFKKIY
jgi:hypothetical protein